MASKKRGRTERRANERAIAKLEDAREKLSRLEPGGAPDRPIVLASASTIEGRAESLGCARCTGETRVVEHDAIEGMRRVRARCKRCGTVREIWVQIADRLLS